MKDQNPVSCVEYNMSDSSTKIFRKCSGVLALTLALSSGACGLFGSDKKTTPASKATVSDGKDVAVDPANIDPDSDFPAADPNDKPEERQADSSAAGEDLPPELRPPGLDISKGERDSKVKEHVSSANAAVANDSDPDKAIREAKLALQVDETSVDAMVLLAHGNVIKGYYDLAEDILLKALERGGKSNKKAYFLLGLVYEKTGRGEKAPGAYQNALTLDPNYKSALVNLGVNHLSTKRYSEAIRIYERLTKSLGMNQAVAWTNLGSAYRGQSLEFAVSNINKRNSLILKAEEAYKKAISLNKNYLNVYYNLGLLYLDADPFPLGNKELDTVVRLKKSKTYLDEYRRLPGADQKLVDETSAVAQKLIDREELLRAKKLKRAAKLKALEEKRKKREADKANNKGSDDDDEGWE